jgi:nucleoside-diphosphate-sugar epimerase
VRVLITGACGYLGSALMQRLIDMNKAEVWGCDTGWFLPTAICPPNLYGVMLVDVRDLPKIETETMFDIIVHLAAISNDPMSEEFEEPTMQINAEAVKEIIDRWPLARHILASSCSVYGGAGKNMRESDSLDPLTAYARSKVKAEEYVRRAEDHVIFRFGTLFGPSPMFRTDLAANNMSIVDPIEYSTAIRPLCSIDTAVRAIVRAIFSREKRNKTYNVANISCRIYDLVNFIVESRLRICGEKVDASRIRGDRDARTYGADCSLALEDGILKESETSVEFFKQEIDKLVVFAWNNRADISLFRTKRLNWLRLMRHYGVINENLRVAASPSTMRAMSEV